MFETIVWATDGSESADRALPYAKALADCQDQRLIALHCEEVVLGRGQGRPFLDDEADLERKIRGQVDQLCNEGVDATFSLTRGPAPHGARMIADAAREIRADVIVVGARRHSPAGMLLGSTTHRLLQLAGCPVLVVPVPSNS